jgi:hypothetical protein
MWVVWLCCEQLRVYYDSSNAPPGAGLLVTRTSTSSGTRHVQRAGRQLP